MVQSKYQNKEELPCVLDAKDIKEFLGIGVNQSYELLHSKQFHVVKIGRTYRVDKDVFIKWLQG
jgi:hypothetical protein